MLLVALVLYGLAWATSIGWFYVADALVWAILVVNVALPTLNLRGLAAERRVTTSGDVFEDDVVTLAVELSSRSFVPKFLVTLTEHCPLAPPEEEEYGFLIGTVAPRGRLIADYEVRCHKRGVYDFGPLRVQTSAPFGLFRARRALDAPLRATVYPRVLLVSAFLNQGSHMGLMPDSSRPDTSGEFRGTREFQHSDRVRDIHWRNSARRGALMVREYDQMPQGELRVAFNPGIELGEGRDTTLEYSVKVAASLARLCFDDGRPFRVLPAGHHGTLATWHGVLEHLARISYGPQPSIQELLRHGNVPGVSVIAVSAADKEALGMLKRGPPPVGPFAVILMEGFGEGEDPGAGDALERLGLPVVRCRVGELPEALASLTRELMAPAAPGRVQRGESTQKVFGGGAR